MERGELDEDTVMMQALEAGAEDFQADEETALKSIPRRTISLPCARR